MVLTDKRGVTGMVRRSPSKQEGHTGAKATLAGAVGAYTLPWVLTSQNHL